MLVPLTQWPVESTCRRVPRMGTTLLRKFVCFWKRAARASVSGIRLLAGVGPLVDGDVALSVEPLGADGAGMRLLAGVDPLMPGDIGLLVKPSGTNGAGIWLLARALGWVPQSGQDATLRSYPHRTPPPLALANGKVHHDMGSCATCRRDACQCVCRKKGRVSTSAGAAAAQEL